MSLVNPRHTQTQMSLFQRFRVRKNTAPHLRHGLAFQAECLVAIDSIRHHAQARGDLFDQRVVAEMTSRRHDHSARAIARFKETEEIVPLETRDGFFPAADRAGNRMIFEKVETEKIVDIVIRSIFRLGNLLQDDRSLPLDFLSVETRMKKNIGQKIDRQRQVFVEYLGVITGVLFGSKGVDHTPDGVHFFGNLRRAAPLRPFEE